MKNVTNLKELETRISTLKDAGLTLIWADSYAEAEFIFEGDIVKVIEFGVNIEVKFEGNFDEAMELIDDAELSVFEISRMGSLHHFMSDLSPFGLDNEE